MRHFNVGYLLRNSVHSSCVRMTGSTTPFSVGAVLAPGGHVGWVSSCCQQGSSGTGNPNDANGCVAVCPVLGPDPTGPPYFITGPVREAR